MNQQELERELIKLKNAEAAGIKWQSKINELQASIAYKLSSLEREFDKCTQAEIRIRNKLKDDAIEYFKENDKKERETSLGTVQLQVRHDLDIYNKEALFDFVAQKNMTTKLVKQEFDKTKLKKWCSAMNELGLVIDGASFEPKYILAIKWPKD